MSLRKDTTELLEAGVISPETAQRIDAYYQAKHAARANLPTLILTVLGTVLVGLGGILIIGHNWDNLSRFVKTIIAFLPLLAGQAACAYALAKKRDSALWAESTASFLLFAVGACIAMLAQVYNISSESGQFMLSWFLLSLPLAYILRSSTVLILCVGLATYYVGETEGNPLYLALIAATLPYYYGLMKRSKPSRFGYLLSWLLPASLLFSCIFLFPKANYLYIIIFYISLFAFLYQLGGIPLLRKQPTASNGYKLLGLLGLAVLLLTVSFRWFWIEVAEFVQNSYGETLVERMLDVPDYSRERIASNLLAVGFTLLLNLLTVTLYVLRNRRESLLRGNPTGLSALVVSLLVALVLLSFTLLSDGATLQLASLTAAQWVVNLLTLLLAIYYIRRGDRENRFVELNYGLLLLAALVACRFFDSELPFLLRGLAFMLIGVALILINFYMHKKRQRHAQP